MTLRLDLHGLTLAVDGDDALVAAARELLGGLPAAPDGRAPDLVLALRRGPAVAAPAGDAAFFHGQLTCHADGQDLIVSDGASRARVAAGGRRVDADVADASLGDAHLFAHVFLLVSLVLALRWHGLFHLHAGALVAPDGRGILVAGTAGAGKSTLTVSLIEEAGCGFLGDDTALVRARGGPAVLSFPRPFHLGPRSAAPFPRLAAFLGTAVATGSDKRRLDAAAAWPGRTRAEMVPALILLPEVAGTEDTICEQVDAAEAFGALVESSALLVVDALPGVREQLDALKLIADRARALRLRLGRDLLARPGGVRTFLE